MKKLMMMMMMKMIIIIIMNKSQELTVFQHASRGQERCHLTFNPCKRAARAFSIDKRCLVTFDPANVPLERLW